MNDVKTVYKITGEIDYNSKLEIFWGDQYADERNVQNSDIQRLSFELTNQLLENLEHIAQANDITGNFLPFTEVLLRVRHLLNILKIEKIPNNQLIAQSKNETKFILSIPITDEIYSQLFFESRLDENELKDSISRLKDSLTDDFSVLIEDLDSNTELWTKKVQDVLCNIRVMRKFLSLAQIQKA